MFYLLIALLSVANAQDIWMEWGTYLNERCKKNDCKEDDCEILGDAFQEILEKAISLVIQETHVDLKHLATLTKQVPYIMFGEHIVDVAIATLKEQGPSETAIIEVIKVELVSWLLGTAKEEAGNFYIMMKEDDGWLQEDIKNYLKNVRAIDIEKLRQVDDEELLKYNKDYQSNDNLNKNEL
ncbi:Uncharacterized protein QTN25_009675 [Entamoeba marina]